MVSGVEVKHRPVYICLNYFYEENNLFVFTDLFCRICK